MKETLRAIQATLSSRKHAIISVVSAIIMLFLAVYIPSVLTPGNTIAFQLSLYTPAEATLTLLFSVLFGLSVGMQSYASHLRKAGKHAAIAKHTGTGAVAFVGTLFSAKLCPICLSAILSFVGIGGSAALVLFSYKTEILAASALMLLLSIYFTSKRITLTCDKCKEQ